LARNLARRATGIQAQHPHSQAPFLFNLIIGGIDRGHLRGLERGEFEYDLRVDLHERNATEARRLLTDELNRAFEAEQRCALIVHGRGLHSENGPVLKAGVIEWLTAPPLAARILAFSSAPLADGAAVAVLAFETATPAGYGRVLTEGDRVLAIREEKDASAAERAVTLCNAGLMALAGRHALALLARIGNDNAAGEYYLPDAVALAVADDGETLLAAGSSRDGGEVRAFSADGSSRAVASIGRAPSMSFFHGSTDAVIADMGVTKCGRAT